MYKQIKDNRGNMMEFVLRTEDNTYIPFAPDNTDYQQYLKWLDEGNTPEPADEGS
jgi:hypothetical protein